ASLAPHLGIFADQAQAVDNHGARRAFEAIRLRGFPDVRRWEIRKLEQGYLHAIEALFLDAWQQFLNGAVVPCRPDQRVYAEFHSMVIHIGLAQTISPSPCSART